MTDRELKTGWNEFMFWVEKFVSDPFFEEDERNFKLEAVKPLQVAVAEFSVGDGWFEPLRQGFHNQHANLVDWRAYQPFLDWAESEPSGCEAALAALWADDGTHGPERIDAFDAIVPADVATRPGGLCNLGAYLLGAIDATRWPNYRITALDLAYELARFPNVPAKSSPGTHYGHALSFLDAMLEEAKARHIAIRDRLDAQGAMWVIAGSGTRGPYGLSAEEWSEFEAFVRVPSTLQKEQKKAAPAPQKRNRPTSRICPQCGHDDEVEPIGEHEDGWLFECRRGSRHSEPFRFVGSS